jgi:hypothetical protein
VSGYPGNKGTKKARLFAGRYHASHTPLGNMLKGGLTRWILYAPTIGAARKI